MRIKAISVLGVLWSAGMLPACGSERPLQVPEAPAAPSSQPEPPPVVSAAPPAASAVSTPATPADKEAPSGAELRADQLFRTLVAAHPDMSVADLEKELAIAPAKDAPLSFDPATVRYFKEVVDRLQLTQEEQSILRKQGVVSVDHVQRYSMASSYHAIYTRDLPVLITTDSILHALHRSYDEILKELEVRLFTETIRRTLTETVAPLARKAQAYKDDRLWESARDVDVYLTVALNLLEGGGAEGAPAKLAVSAKFPDDDPRVEEQLRNIDSLSLRGATVHGNSLEVDYTQFRPRGHYTESKELQRYFRTLMWLGRADLGFVLEPAKEGPAGSDPDRGLRDAALLTMLVENSGSARALDAMSGVIDFLVGRSDNLRLDQMSKALASAGIKDPLKLADGRALASLHKSVAGAGEQQIRSQALMAEGEGKETMPPAVFQLFGQRFLIDSFVLSKVVFDSIKYKGQQPNRQMPSGRDVMAALGNDEAVRLLEPELEAYKYSTNLYSARKLIDGYPKEEWQKSVYGLWLDTLRTLDDAPSTGHFPETMRREAWRRKHLETQLASWAELRHDTILYGKQSYSTMMCEYPEGYVEPYPMFFSKLRVLSDEASQKIATMDVGFGPKLEAAAKNLRDGYVKFFERFGETMELLELLARKELAAKPFTTDETWFLKRTIDVRGGGSGPPRYDGWYPRLLYGGNPLNYKPVVADVHSAPNDGTVLQEGVGDVNFLVVAVDNEKDRALYVGPAYSYYEFPGTMNDRLTDETWQALIEQNHLPPRPAWTNVFRGKPLARTLPYVQREDERDPRVLDAVKRLHGVSGDKRRRAFEEIMRLMETSTVPLRKAAPKKK